MPRTNKGHLSRADQNKDRLKRLAAFGPIFRDPKTVFGEWIFPTTGKGTKEDPFESPWFQTSEYGHRFSRTANDLFGSWFEKSQYVDRFSTKNGDGPLGTFNWEKWINTPEGHRLYTSRGAIASANGEQLARLAFTLARMDRFCAVGCLAGLLRGQDSACNRSTCGSVAPRCSQP